MQRPGVVGQVDLDVVPIHHAVAIDVDLNVAAGRVPSARSTETPETPESSVSVSSDGVMPPVKSLLLMLSTFTTESGRAKEALQLLQPVYAQFTEGHATADLQRAKLILDGLEPMVGQKQAQSKKRAREPRRSG